jgi:hypothetical protein
MFDVYHIPSIFPQLNQTSMMVLKQDGFEISWIDYLLSKP